MYFNIKSYLKSNRNHIRQALKRLNRKFTKLQWCFRKSTHQKIHPTTEGIKLEYTRGQARDISSLVSGNKTPPQPTRVEARLRASAGYKNPI